MFWSLWAYKLQTSHSYLSNTFADGILFVWYNFPYAFLAFYNYVNPYSPFTSIHPSKSISNKQTHTHTLRHGGWTLSQLALAYLSSPVSWPTPGAAWFSFYFSSLRITRPRSLPIFAFVVSLPKITLPLCRSYHLSLTQEPLGLPLLLFFRTVYLKIYPPCFSYTVLRPPLPLRKGTA